MHNSSNGSSSGQLRDGTRCLLIKQQSSENAQPRDDDEKRHLDMYRELSSAVQELLQAELSSDEVWQSVCTLQRSLSSRRMAVLHCSTAQLHSAMFLVYETLTNKKQRSNKGAATDDDDDDDDEESDSGDEDTTKDAKLTSVSMAQFEHLVELFGPIDRRVLTRVAKLTRTLALWRNTTTMRDAPAADTTSSSTSSKPRSTSAFADSVGANEFAPGVAFDITAYLDDRDMPTTISAAPMFSGEFGSACVNDERAHTARKLLANDNVPQLNIVEPHMKKTLNLPTTGPAPSTSVSSTSSSMSNRQARAAPAPAASIASDLALIAATDQKDKDWYGSVVRAHIEVIAVPGCLCSATVTCKVLATTMCRHKCAHTQMCGMSCDRVTCRNWRDRL
jgi:hypothetical protein